MVRVTVASRCPLLIPFMTVSTVTMELLTPSLQRALAQRSQMATSTETLQWVRVTQSTPSSSPMAAREGKLLAAPGPSRGIPAMSAAKPTPRLPTWVGTNRHTARWTASWQRNARPVGRCTCPCPPWPCTSSPMTSSTSVMCVGKRSVGHGFYRVTCALTRVRNRSGAPTVGRPSQTARTCVLTCRPIQPSSTSSANAATRPSRSRVTWISTTSQPASKAPSLPSAP